MPISRTLWNQRIKAPDGVEIALDVLLPAGPGPFPIVVTRTPYGRMSPTTRGTPLIERGYGMVLVDVRGRGDSGGAWRPFAKDIDDGYAVVEWIAAQPWSTGKIGMIGGSYNALTQWWTAAGRPPHLSCIIPQCVGCVRESEVPHLGSGIPMQYWLWWMTLVMGRTNQNAGAPSWEDQMPSLPLRSLDARLGIETSAWQSYIEGKMDYLSPDFALTPEQVAALDIPVLVTVGWWDDQQTMVAWRSLQKAKSAKDCRLLIGAWDHAGNAAPRPVLGGLDVSASALDMPAYLDKFLALHLKGEESEMARAPRCHIFQTGAHRWDDIEEWPHPAAAEVPFYLASDGDARSLRGNGRLVREAPRCGATVDRFTFDPTCPARDMINLTMFAWSDPPLDIRYLLRRKDVLVYDTQVLFLPLSLSGRIRYVLFASSDRVDTDLLTWICDVQPDGRSVILGGACSLRLRYRQGPEPRPLVPGEVIEASLDGQWLHHVVLPGHRFRVVIASANFPIHARNSGTSEFWADATILLPQTNAIHHSAARSSRVLLPVVPEGDG
jgi:uncharacterized protein